MKMQIARFGLGLLFALMSDFSPAKENGPYFWEVSKEGEKNGKPFYVLGTVHMGVGLEDFQCSDQISNRLAETPVVLVEYHAPKGVDFLGMLMQIEETENPSPYTIGFNNLNAQSRQFFKEKIPSDLLNRLGVDVGQIEKASLLALMVTLSFTCLSDHPSIMESLMPLLNKQLNIKIMKEAEDKNKPLVYMDNINSEKVKKYFSTLKDRVLLSLLVEHLEGLIGNYEKWCTIDYLQERFKRPLLLEVMIESYINGEFLDVVDRLKEAGYSGEVLERKKWHYEQIMLKNRNEIWLPKIKKAYQEYGTAFVVGGLGHFIDAHNLIDMLKKDGFSVKRYNRNCVAE